jgi:hypothetical protein
MMSTASVAVSMVSNVPAVLIVRERNQAKKNKDVM